MRLPQWVRLPSGWIEDHGLHGLKWAPDGKGSDNTAALMALTVIAHHADPESGIARLTYDSLCQATGLSRSKLSNGLGVLESIQVIGRMPDGRSTYGLANYSAVGGWGKFPARSMYSSGGRVAAFEDFQLRSATELNAMKLFFLFVARRGRDTNMANISYDKITEYTGILKVKIKPAISLLAAQSLVYVERLPSQASELGVANAYRIVGIDSQVHMGTVGRRMDSADFAS
ncbi:MAG: hypothetical protein ACJ71Q_03415 [Terriglobales bacterium]